MAIRRKFRIIVKTIAIVLSLSLVSCEQSKIESSNNSDQIIDNVVSPDKKWEISIREALNGRGVSFYEININNNFQKAFPENKTLISSEDYQVRFHTVIRWGKEDVLWVFSSDTGVDYFMQNMSGRWEKHPYDGEGLEPAKDIQSQIDKYVRKN